MESVSFCSLNESMKDWYCISSGILGYNVINDISAHPCWHWLITHRTPPGLPLGQDGHPVCNFSGINNLKRVWASSTTHYYGKKVFSDKFKKDILVNSKTLDVSYKNGSSGRLILSPIEFNVIIDSEIFLSETRLGIYRESSRINNSHKLLNKTPDNLFFVKSVVIDFNSVDLFRYSALLKVSHRIHYDYNYATKVEGYPDIVVHGPMLGQIMMTFFKSIFPDSNIFSVNFRAYHPLFINEKCCIKVFCDSGNKKVIINALKNDSILSMSAHIDLNKELTYE